MTNFFVVVENGVATAQKISTTKVWLIAPVHAVLCRAAFSLTSHLTSSIDVTKEFQLVYVCTTCDVLRSTYFTSCFLMLKGAVNTNGSFIERVKETEVLIKPEW